MRDNSHIDNNYVSGRCNRFVCQDDFYRCPLVLIIEDIIFCNDCETPIVYSLVEKVTKKTLNGLKRAL